MGGVLFLGNWCVTGGLAQSGGVVVRVRGHGQGVGDFFVNISGALCLVRALGTVNQGAMWEVLRKFGMPGHFVIMLVRPRAGAVIDVKIGEEDTAMGSSIGVQRGAYGGLIPFLFIMQAPEPVEWPVTKPTFRTRANGVTSGGGVQPQTRRGILRAIRLALRGRLCHLLRDER